MKNVLLKQQTSPSRLCRTLMNTNIFCHYLNSSKSNILPKYSSITNICKVTDEMKLKKTTSKVMWKKIYELIFIPEKSLNEEEGCAECTDFNAMTSNAAFVFFPRLWKIMFLILFQMWNIERNFEQSPIIKNKTKNSIFSSATCMNTTADLPPPLFFENTSLLRANCYRISYARLKRKLAIGLTGNNKQ